MLNLAEYDVKYEIDGNSRRSREFRGAGWMRQRDEPLMRSCRNETERANR